MGILNWDSRFFRSLGLHRRELRAWAMYDWAASSAQTTIAVAVFPIFFTAVAGAGRVHRVHEITAAPAPAASPAVEAAPAVQSQR